MKVELHLKSDEQQAHLRSLFDRGPGYAVLLDQTLPLKQGARSGRGAARGQRQEKANQSLEGHRASNPC